MIWFVESPWPSVMLGLAAEVILAILLMQTRRGNIVGAMVAVATLTVGLVVVERLVVTENEQIEDTLDGAARAMAANDAQGLLAMFTDDSPRRNDVQSILSRVTVRTAKIGRDLEIRVNKLTVPFSASAYFTGHIDARENRDKVPYERVTRKLKVTLHKEGEHWRVFDYSDADTHGTSGTSAPGR